MTHCQANRFQTSCVNLAWPHPTTPRPSTPTQRHKGMNAHIHTCTQTKTNVDFIYTCTNTWSHVHTHTHTPSRLLTSFCHTLLNTLPTTIASICWFAQLSLPALWGSDCLQVEGIALSLLLWHVQINIDLGGGQQREWRNVFGSWCERRKLNKFLERWSVIEGCGGTIRAERMRRRLVINVLRIKERLLKTPNILMLKLRWSTCWLKWLSKSYQQYGVSKSKHFA